MSESIVLQLADGTSRAVPDDQAKRVVERLWAEGLEPGAAPCAVQIHELLEAPLALRRPLELDERQTRAVVRALDAALHAQP